MKVINKNATFSQIGWLIQWPVQNHFGQLWRCFSIIKESFYFTFKYATDFKDKVDMFDFFIAQQRSLINTLSKLPFTFLKRTERVISSIWISSNYIVKINRDLDPTKGHDHNMISIYTLKICGKSTSKPLKIIFKSCIKKGQFPDNWNKAVEVRVPVHKTDGKQV